MTFYRDGKPKTATVTIAELPAGPGGAVVARIRRPRAPRRPRTARRPSIEIDQVVTGSPAFQAGLRPGMRILAVGDNPAPVNTLGRVRGRRPETRPEPGLAADGSIARRPARRRPLGGCRRRPSQP